MFSVVYDSTEALNLDNDEYGQMRRATDDRQFVDIYAVRGGCVRVLIDEQSVLGVTTLYIAVTNGPRPMSLDQMMKDILARDDL